jgi:hypothetical protein
MIVDIVFFLINLVLAAPTANLVLKQKSGVAEAYRVNFLKEFKKYNFKMRYEATLIFVYTIICMCGIPTQHLFEVIGIGNSKPFLYVVVCFLISATVFFVIFILSYLTVAVINKIQRKSCDSIKVDLAVPFIYVILVMLTFVFVTY